MTNTELNKYHRGRMKGACSEAVQFDWQDGEFMDFLLGGLPVIHKESLRDKAQDKYHRLEKAYRTYSFFSTDKEKFFSDIKELVNDVKQDVPYWYGLNPTAVEDVLNMHKCCLISGEGGIGKSYFIKCFEQELEKRGTKHLCLYGKFIKDIEDVLHDSKPQGVLSQEAAKLITEQVVGRFALSDCHVIPQNGHHRSAEGNDLNLAVLCVSENNLSAAQVYILILNVANCGSPTTAVQKEVYDDPIPILAELAIGFRLLQECEKFLVCVSFLYSFSCFVDFEIGFCVALFIAPREKTFQSASVAVDRTVGQTFLSHLKNHVVEDCRIEAIDGEGHIQSFRNCVKMLFVSCYCFVFYTSGCDC